MQLVYEIAERELISYEFGFALQSAEVREKGRRFKRSFSNATRKLSLFRAGGAAGADSSR